MTAIPGGLFRGNDGRLGVCLTLLLVATLLCASASQAASLDFPPLSGRVVDEAGVLAPRTARELSRVLAGHEQRTGQQIVVVTLESLQGQDISAYGYQLGRHWGIGEKGENNGVLLIVAPKEQEVRIEVGYGLEGKIPDAIAFDIVHNVIVPHFKEGNLPAGIVAGTQAIIQALGGKYKPGSSPQAKRDNAVGNSLFGLLLFGGFMAFSFFARSGRSRRGRGGSGFLTGAIIGGMLGSSLGNGGGFGGGGFGGGFGGGGGSFGGGGASGGW